MVSAVIGIMAIGLTLALIVNDSRWRRKYRDVEQQRKEAQERFESHKRGWSEETERVCELQEILQRTNNKAEGYDALIVRTLDGFRKLSDEYEKVRRGRK